MMVSEGTSTVQEDQTSPVEGNDVSSQKKEKSSKEDQPKAGRPGMLGGCCGASNRDY